jgi:hypothetical protein
MWGDVGNLACKLSAGATARVISRFPNASQCRRDVSFSAVRIGRFESFIYASKLFQLISDRFLI